ncbi:hypothetical protein Tco_0108939 [Tanacetum coccineum]
MWAVLAVSDISEGCPAYQGAAPRQTLHFLSFGGEGDALTKGWMVINVEVIKERLVRHCLVEHDLEKEIRVVSNTKSIILNDFIPRSHVMTEFTIVNFVWDFGLSQYCDGLYDFIWCWNNVCMFEVSTLHEEDSATFVPGGAKRSCSDGSVVFAGGETFGTSFDLKNIPQKCTDPTVRFLFYLVKFFTISSDYVACAAKDVKVFESWFSVIDDVIWCLFVSWDDEDCRIEAIIGNNLSLKNSLNRLDEHLDRFEENTVIGYLEERRTRITITIYTNLIRICVIVDGDGCHDSMFMAVRIATKAASGF